MADKNDGSYYMGNENLPNRNWKGEYTPEKIKELKEAKKNILKFAERYFYILAWIMVSKRLSYILLRRQHLGI